MNAPVNPLYVPNCPRDTVDNVSRILAYLEDISIGLSVHNEGCVALELSGEAMDGQYHLIRMLRETLDSVTRS